MDEILRADRPDVIDEVFDGEAVVLHMGTGCYYALDPLASRLWNALAEGRRPADVARALAEAHGIDLAASVTFVEPFVARLVEERLLVRGDVEAPSAPLAPGEPPAGPPSLERFDDVQDLLLLDPIHDIDLDGDGWPTRPAAA